MCCYVSFNCFYLISIVLFVVDFDSSTWSLRLVILERLSNIPQWHPLNLFFHIWGRVSVHFSRISSVLVFRHFIGSLRSTKGKVALVSEHRLCLVTTFDNTSTIFLQQCIDKFGTCDTLILLFDAKGLKFCF